MSENDSNNINQSEYDYYFKKFCKNFSDGLNKVKDKDEKLGFVLTFVRGKGKDLIDIGSNISTNDQIDALKSAVDVLYERRINDIETDPNTDVDKSYRYPDGKLSDDDDGETRIGLGVKNGRVEFVFTKPMKWLAMRPDEAAQFGLDVIKTARKIGLKSILEIEL